VWRAQWATNRGSVANGQAFYQPNTPDTTIQPVQVQGISYAPSGYAQAAQPFYSNPYTPASSSYQQPAAQYANIEVRSPAHIVRLPPQPSAMLY